MKIAFVVATAASGGVAFGAIDAVNATQMPLPGTMSVLQTDGSWDKGLNATLGTAAVGEDFGFPADFGDTMWMRENWVGGANSSAGFATTLPMSGAQPAPLSTAFPININKEVTNNGGFFADEFVVVLNETGGATIDNVFANPNAAFSDVTINDLGSTIEITYGIGTGTGLANGATTVFNFGFEVDGTISFEIVQTLIPAPGAVVLAGVAGVAAVRRRR